LTKHFQTHMPERPEANKVIVDVSGKFRKRVSMVSAYCQNKFIAPMHFEGYCNTELFNTWLEEMLLPKLKKGQTVILDNASFHKSKKTVELIESVECHVLFLPPYSPDFNPIEHAWANIKRIIRNIHSIDDSLIVSIEKAFNMFQPI